MKHICLLFAFGLALSFSYGQELKTNFSLPDINRTEKYPEKTLEAFPGFETTIPGEKILTEIAGYTYYDLQTYGAMPQRIYAYPDGTIGATWMMAFATTDWIDRGTGYNYYDGNSWDIPPVTRVESGRTGWPSYAPLGAGGEIIVAHYLNGDEWVLLFNHRPAKGSGNWSEFMLDGPAIGTGLVWPAMITSGPSHNTIHILARTYGNLYMGQDGALLYSRSSDGGATWDIQNYFFSDLGPAYFENIGADEYHWAQPVGDTLAFAVGFGAGHACIMKSTDNGITWQKTEVFHSPFYPPPGVATPTFGAGDGSCALALDPQGKAHVVFGRMRHVYDDTGAAFFYPATDGLIYWNEDMDELDTTIISSYTLDYLELNGNLVGWVQGGVENLIGFPSYYTSLTSNPQIIIDDYNRIMVVWSGVTAYDNGVWNYRRIFGNLSEDGGSNWNGMTDLTSELVFIFSECVFPALAPKPVNNMIHFIFQEDNEPGIYVWAEQQPKPGDNRITHMDILLPNPPTGISDNETGDYGNGLTSTIYPNPFSDFTWLEVFLPEKSPVELSVYDMTGKELYKIDCGVHESGSQIIPFENNVLNKGTYFYSFKTNQGTTTGKMVVF